MTSARRATPTAASRSNQGRGRLRDLRGVRAGWSAPHRLAADSTDQVDAFHTAGAPGAATKCPPGPSTAMATTAPSCSIPTGTISRQYSTPRCSAPPTPARLLRRRSSRNPPRARTGCPRAGRSPSVTGVDHHRRGPDAPERRKAGTEIGQRSGITRTDPRWCSPRRTSHRSPPSPPQLAGPRRESAPGRHPVGQARFGSSAGNRPGGETCPEFGHPASRTSGSTGRAPGPLQPSAPPRKGSPGPLRCHSTCPRPSSAERSTTPSQRWSIAFSRATASGG